MVRVPGHQRHPLCQWLSVQAIVLRAHATTSVAPGRRPHRRASDRPSANTDGHLTPSQHDNGHQIQARLTRDRADLKLLMPLRLARPEGSGRTPPTIVIEGLEELVQALLAA